MFLFNFIKNDLQRLTELNKSRFSKIINHAVLCKSFPPCSPTENHNWLEGVRQWHWTSSLWSRGINCQLRSFGWWPERDSAISGTSILLLTFRNLLSPLPSSPSAPLQLQLLCWQPSTSSNFFASLGVLGLGSHCSHNLAVESTPLSLRWTYSYLLYHKNTYICRLINNLWLQQPTQLQSCQWPGSTAVWQSTPPSTTWPSLLTGNSWKTKLFPFLQVQSLLPVWQRISSSSRTTSASGTSPTAKSPTWMYFQSWCHSPKWWEELLATIAGRQTETICPGRALSGFWEARSALVRWLWRISAGKSRGYRFSLHKQRDWTIAWICVRRCKTEQWRLWGARTNLRKCLTEWLRC